MEDILVNNNDSIVISQEELKRIETFEKIGAGACANLYKNDNKVYKILKENSKGIYRKGSLEKLAGVKNSICVFPNEVLKDEEGKYIGYTMDLVNGIKFKEIFQDLSFEQLQQAISNAEIGIKALSEQKIAFDDMHFDNIMWDNEGKSIKIIDTDFFKFAEEISTDELAKSNLTKFNNQMETLLGIRDGTLAKYLNKNTEYTQFYKEWFKRGLMGEQMSSCELIDKIKSVAEKDFGVKFTCISEIVEKAKSKVKEYEDEELDIENWSEGNEHLRNLLRSCRDNNVPSMYCRAGHGKDKPAYITVQMNEKTTGKIYNIMSQMTDMKDIAFRFSQKEFGKDPSFTVYMNKEKDKDEIMDIISEAMMHEQKRDKLPEKLQKLTQINDIFMNEGIRFDLEYGIGKNNSKLLLENLRFGNSEYIEKSDFKKMGLKSRKDMFGNLQYYKNGMSEEKSNKVLSDILENLNQIYDMEFERPEELSFGKKLAQRIASNKVLNRLPIINKLINKQKLLPEATKEVHSMKERRNDFINATSKNGEYRKLSERTTYFIDTKQSRSDVIEEKSEPDDLAL